PEIVAVNLNPFTVELKISSSGGERNIYLPPNVVKEVTLNESPANLSIYYLSPLSNNWVLVTPAKVLGSGVMAETHTTTVTVTSTETVTKHLTETMTETHTATTTVTRTEKLTTTETATHTETVTNYVTKTYIATSTATETRISTTTLTKFSTIYSTITNTLIKILHETPWYDKALIVALVALLGVLSGAIILRRSHQ
ncbi:MAG: hypothetical protein J7L55_02630, partial [Desulfurococcales archaeon]|nr:hypothetical protein [Desulfurococcales archaeon]